MVKTDNWRPFGPRDPHEPHRASTPLELLFDLVIVIAIASAAQGLHHGIAQGHAASAVITFVLAFFATWWAWVNFTWFASAYDNDGPVYRAITCWIMGGALIIASGIPAMFAGLQLAQVVIGYIVMRTGMVAFWLISARCDPPHRATALTYAGGIALVQVYWTLALLVFRPDAGPDTQAAVIALFVLGIVLEMAVPIIAERRGVTPWHREHLIERHGLFTIIVLGEVLLSGATAFELTGESPAAAAGPVSAGAAALILIAVSALLITFAMWWLYFSQEGPLADHDAAERNLSGAFGWAYPHALVYASGAATGAGFLVMVDVLRSHADSHAGMAQANLAVAVPLAAYMAALWLVRDRTVLEGAGRHVLLPFALAVLLAALLPGLAALPAMALLGVTSVYVRSRMRACEG